jgi:hypothetical protein
VSNIEKIIDRVRKLFALSANAGSEHEAAAAAARATALVAEYQLTEAQLRVENEELPPEPIEKAARLEPDEPEIGRKRVAWKETIALAVAKDLGVRMHWTWKKVWTNGRYRKYSDVRGFGRESAIQTWRYTCQYLWRTIDELAEAQDNDSWQSVRAYRNAYRVGCAQRISERIFEARIAREKTPMASHTAAAAADVRDPAPVVEPGDTSKALAIIERDREEVDREYKAYSKGFGTMSSVGSTSSRSGYDAGRDAGDRVRLGGGGKGLPAGQGRLRGRS